MPRSRYHDNTTCEGVATSAVGPHSRRLEESPRAGSLPHPSQYSTPRFRFLYCRRGGEQCCPTSPDLHQCRATAAGRPRLLAPLPHLTSTVVLASRRSLLCHLPMMFRTGKANQADHPAAVRCKPNCPMKPMPQAPSFDAVPHRTDSCQTTPAAAVRCKQPQPTDMRQPPAATIAANATTRARQHPFSLPHGGKANTIRGRP